MKRCALILVIFALFLLSGCSGDDVGSGYGGGGHTTVTGLRAYVETYDFEYRGLDPRENKETKFYYDYIIEKGEQYVLHVGFVQGGGSTPKAPMCSALTLDYDKEVLEITPFGDPSSDYVLVAKKEVKNSAIIVQYKDKYACNVVVSVE